jgi:hypothetical protein
VSDPLDQDPGWPLSAKALLLFVIPGFATRLAKHGDALIRLRQVFVAFSVSLVLFQLALFGIGTTPGADENVQLAIGVLAIGGLQVLVATPMLNRYVALDCTDEGTLAGSYYTRFFARIALSQAAALFGFVGFFIANVWWVYPASLVWTAIGYARLAPTKANLEEDQRELTQRGCALSLVGSLRGAGST